MKVLEPGHIYELRHLDAPGHEILTFCRRNSAAITHHSEHAGTNTQEVIRALIDRSKFLNGVIPCTETEDAIFFLRMALFCYEARAYRRKQQKLNKERGLHDEGRERYADVPFTEPYIEYWPDDAIETRPVGNDGHLVLPGTGLAVGGHGGQVGEDGR